MTDLESMIMRDIEDDSSIDANDIVLRTASRGFLKKRKTIHVEGFVNTELAREKVTKIAEHHAGDNFSVSNELAVAKK